MHHWLVALFEQHAKKTQRDTEPTTHYRYKIQFQSYNN